MKLSDSVRAAGYLTVAAGASVAGAAIGGVAKAVDVTVAGAKYPVNKAREELETQSEARKIRKIMPGLTRREARHAVTVLDDIQAKPQGESSELPPPLVIETTCVEA